MHPIALDAHVDMSWERISLIKAWPFFMLNARYLISVNMSYLCSSSYTESPPVALTTPWVFVIFARFSSISTTSVVILFSLILTDYCLIVKFLINFEEYLISPMPLTSKFAKAVFRQLLLRHKCLKLMNNVRKYFAENMEKILIIFKLYGK
jgi:hypothetical protein